ncbi:MAG: hypothetical protein ACRDD8_00740 [Bacteroidales bacterium]
MKRDIDIILDNLDELRALVQAMSEENDIPSILFKFSYEKTNKIEKLLQELQETQSRKEMIEEDSHQQLSTTVDNKVETFTSAEKEAVALGVAEEEIAPEVVINNLVEPSLITSDNIEDITTQVGVIEELRSSSDSRIALDSYEHEVLAEKFIQKDTNLTLNEKLIQNSKEDIRKSLSLNDRFRFSRELFSNDNVRMEKCFDEINQAIHFSELELQLRNTYKWDKDNEYATEFLALIKKRFN